VVFKVLMGKPEGKRPFGRPRCRWEDGIRMDLEEIGLRVWIVRTVVSAVMNLQVLTPQS
jgi:hypothetical protein